jgi:CRP/FNR family cyclic AMP-dependent transcriptional regulator
MSLMTWIAWLAAVLVFATFFMKTIVPLRMMAIVSNLAFIAYGLLGLGQDIFAKVAPILVLHCSLLPLNLLRLFEVQRSIRAVRSMQGAHATAGFLTPYMESRRYPAGSVLFSRGDPADKVYVLESGTVRIVEFDRQLKPGELFGEIGVFNDKATRTGTAVCDEDCQLFSVSSAKILELFYQDQRFAFQIARRLARYA